MVFRTHLRIRCACTTYLYFDDAFEKYIRQNFVYAMSHTDDVESDFVLNIVTLSVFFVLLCILCSFCLLWDTDFWTYRSPRERQYVIRHVIIRDGNEDYV